MQILQKKLLLPVAALVMAVAAAGPSQATGSVVNAALWDKGVDATMATNLGLGMGGDMSKATMGISATPETVKPGMVTFEVLNTSKDQIHEMIVAKLADLKKPLPYIADENRVDEDKEGDLGEVSEARPGQVRRPADRDEGGYVHPLLQRPGPLRDREWTMFTVK